MPKMKNVYFLNGKAVEPKAALDFINPTAAGIFETFRIYNGKVFRLEEHLERLAESAQTVGLFPRLSSTASRGRKKEAGAWLKHVRREIQLAVKGFGKPEAVARVTWVEAGLIVMMGERRAPPELYKTGIALQTSPVRRSLSHAAPPEAKSTDYMNALMATLEPRPEDVYEWIFLDQQGFVTEVRIGNIFIIDSIGKKKRLRTPPLHGILNGVTRRFVIECALLEGLEVREEPLTRHEIYTADESFLTNTSWEVLPVRSLDARLIGREVPGPLTTRLHQSFKKRVQKECP